MNEPLLNKPLLVILMSSKADEAFCRKIGDEAAKLGLEVVTRVCSAHTTPQHTLNILRQYETDPRPKVYITVASHGNALAGISDGMVLGPVIACPPHAADLAEAEIYSLLHTPQGIASAVVLDPSNAALLAAKILGLLDEEVRAKVIEKQQQYAEKILRDDSSV